MKAHHYIILIALGAILGLQLMAYSRSNEILEQTRISNMYLRGSVPAAPTPTPDPICQPTPPLVLR